MTDQKVTAVLVAAGSGSRMGLSSPKQYQLIGDKTMLERSLDALLAEPRIEKVIVVISPTDIVGQELSFEDPRVEIARVGGRIRAESVKNGITYAAIASSDWVLVHDAARPCLLPSDLKKLIDFCLENDKGAILAVPLNDTLKQEGPGETIKKTIPRTGLWCAQTPQCFKNGELLKALEQAGAEVTDEASAMEAAGYKPAIIEGTPTNIKVTRPMDLWMAKAIFQAREKGFIYD